MKRVFIFAVFIFIVNIFLFSNDTQNINIDNKWVDSIMAKRLAYVEKAEHYEIVEFDFDTLEYLNKSNVVFGDFEGSVATLLYGIMIDTKKYNDKNIILGLHILTNKFKNKDYVINYGLELSNSAKINNYQVLVKIIDCFTIILDAQTQDKIFVKLGLISSKINTYIFNKSKNGSNMVISYFMSFLLKYMTLVEDEKIEDKNREKILEYCDKLQMDQKVSEFEDLKNGAELKQAFFFYKSKGKYK